MSVRRANSAYKVYRRGSVGTSSRAKPFLPHYRQRWHSSTGLVGSPPLTAVSVGDSRLVASW